MKKHYYINRHIKQHMVSSTKYENQGSDNLYIGMFESKESFIASCELRTKMRVDNNDGMIKKGNFQMPPNLPSWEKYDGNHDYLIWLYVNQYELSMELEKVLREKLTD